jgi:hypothetical protein
MNEKEQLEKGLEEEEKKKWGAFCVQDNKKAQNDGVTHSKERKLDYPVLYYQKM